MVLTVRESQKKSQSRKRFHTLIKTVNSRFVLGGAKCANKDYLQFNSFFLFIKLILLCQK